MYDFAFVEFIELNENDSAESIVEKLNEWSKRTLYCLKKKPEYRNTWFIAEPFENVNIRMDYFPREITMEYDSIVQYWSACILHVLDVMGRVNGIKLCECKKLLNLSPNQERIIWR